MANEIIKILDDLGRRIGVAIDWSNENVMPYLEELMNRFIQWEISTSIVWGAVGIAMLIIGLIGVMYMWKHRESYDYFGDPDEGITWMFTAFIIAIILGVIVVLTQCFDVCKAIYMPEMTIYEYIQNLIRTTIE